MNESCPLSYNKLIRNEKKCISNCSIDSIYKFTFSNECFEECPLGTISKDNKYICDLVCPEDFPFENKTSNECVDICNPYDYLKKICFSNNKKSKKIKKALDSIISNLLDNLFISPIYSEILNLVEGDKEVIVV